MGAIVIGYVDTPQGHAALRAGVQEAMLRSEQVVVVHSSKGGVALGGAEAIEIKATLQAVQQDLQAEHVSFQIRNLVRGNDVAEDLAAVAEEYGADIIVIGLRHRTSVGKFLLGSDAQQIIQGAPCPVLCVRASAA